MVISKKFGPSRKALFITMDSNLIFKSKLLINFFKKNIAGNKAYKNNWKGFTIIHGKKTKKEKKTGFLPLSVK